MPNQTSKFRVEVYRYLIQKQSVIVYAKNKKAAKDRVQNGASGLLWGSDDEIVQAEYEAKDVKEIGDYEETNQNLERVVDEDDEE